MWRKDVRCLWLLPPLPKHGPAVGSPVDGFLPNTSSKSAQRATLRGNTRQAYTSSSGEDRFAFFSEFAIVRKKRLRSACYPMGETWSHANPGRRLRRQEKTARPMPVKSNVIQLLVIVSYPQSPNPCRLVINPLVWGDFRMAKPDI